MTFQERGPVIAPKLATKELIDVLSVSHFSIFVNTLQHYRTATH